MKTIGPYQVQGVLGRGSTGVVYQGLDPSGPTEIAVKLFRRPTKEAAVPYSRLWRDAQAAAALGHPNLALVLEVGEYRGQPFVAAEMVAGVDLGQVMAGHKPFPFEWILDVWRQMSEGLADAHRNGLMHLDLKPRDVRVTPTGEVKIVDFGVAHLKSPDGSVSTLHYHAPEQVDGHHRPDARADIFAVGAIVYELAARQKAFPGEDTAAVIHALTRGHADRKALPSTAFSPGFEVILLKSLARNPEDRYASFETLHEDLVGLVRDAAPRLRAERARSTSRESREKTAITFPAPPSERQKAGGSDQQRETLYVELTEARAENHLPRALDICRRLLQLDPGDEAARQVASEIQAIIQDREVEQLVGLALSYAVDGDVGLAMKIADKVEKLAPWSPRFIQLQVYLNEEGGRAYTLAAAAREHMTRGAHAAAREAAEQALAIRPTHAEAQKILDELAAAPPPVTAPPVAPPPSRQPAPPAPPAVRKPSPAAPPAARPAPAAAPAASRAAPARDPQEPRDSRQKEIEALTTAALDHFVANQHAKARSALERLLNLDPGNKKARELLRILGALG